MADAEETAEVAVHAAGYHKFSLLVKWVMVVAATTIPFLVIWFATPAGFWGGLAVGLVILAAGIFALRHGWAHSSEDESLDYPQTRQAG